MNFSIGAPSSEVDPLVCPKCQGAMRVSSSIEDPSVIRTILDHDDHLYSDPQYSCDEYIQV
jgi:hypothetical protein